MDDDQMFGTVLQIVASSFNVPISAVNSESSPQNVLGWDSLKHIDLVMRIEREFGIQFRPAEIPLLNSVQNIYELLKKTSE